MPWRPGLLLLSEQVGRSGWRRFGRGVRGVGRLRVVTDHQAADGVPARGRGRPRVLLARQIDAGGVKVGLDRLALTQFNSTYRLEHALEGARCIQLVLRGRSRVGRNPALAKHASCRCCGPGCGARRRPFQPLDVTVQVTARFGRHHGNPACRTDRSASVISDQLRSDATAMLDPVQPGRPGKLQQLRTAAGFRSSLTRSILRNSRRASETGHPGSVRCIPVETERSWTVPRKRNRMTPAACSNQGVRRPSAPRRPGPVWAGRCSVVPARRCSPAGGGAGRRSGEASRRRRFAAPGRNRRHRRTPRPGADRPRGGHRPPRTTQRWPAARSGRR